MTTTTFDWPQSARALLSQAQRQGELVKLIMAGTLHLESWLIENRILPGLQDKKLTTLRFSAGGPDGNSSTAMLLPLPDGSAFARTTAGLWTVLEADEALHEVQYLGFRFAPGTHWREGFTASAQLADRAPVPLAPADVARVWQDITGTRPEGFAEGTLDHMQAVGMNVFDTVFNVQGRLGL